MTQSALAIELAHGCDGADHAEAHPALFEDPEAFYNRARLHASLGYRRPWADQQQTASSAKSTTRLLRGNAQ